MEASSSLFEAQPLSLTLLVADFFTLQRDELLLFGLTCKQFINVANTQALILVREYLRNEYLMSPLHDMVNGALANCRSPLSVARALGKEHILLIGGATHAQQSFTLNHKTDQLHETHHLLSAKRENSQVAFVGGSLFVLSGEHDDSCDTMEVFCRLTMTWQLFKGKLPIQVRRSSICGTTTGSLCLSGGKSADTATPLQSVYFLSPSPHSDWVLATQPLSAPRYGHTAVAYRNSLWICGGVLGNESTSSIEVFSMNPSCREQPPNTVPWMQNRRFNFNLLVVHDDLYAIGGDDDCTIEKYDGKENRWDIVTSFPRFRQNFSACLDGGDGIYVFGGQSRRKEFLSTYDRYSIRNMCWIEESVVIDAETQRPFLFGQAVFLPCLLTAPTL
jgi:hypothetical protein